MKHPSTEKVGRLSDPLTSTLSPQPEARAAASTVTLNIERLVIDGIAVSAGQAAQLQLALIEELTCLIGVDPLLVTGGAIPRLQAPPIQLSAPFNPREVGCAIARSIHQSLSRPL